MVKGGRGGGVVWREGWGGGVGVRGQIMHQLFYLFHVEVTLALGLGDFRLQFLLADLGEAEQRKGDSRKWVRERKIYIYIVSKPG